MDLKDPTQAVTTSLDGTVLAVLAASGTPLTVGEVAAQTAWGSEIGVRKCLSRLVEQGTVIALEMGRNRVHVLNRDHIAAPVAQGLADLRTELFARLRRELDKWRPRPHYACVFGSAARGDGGPQSDIDLLLVHVPFPGDPKPPRQKRIRDKAVQVWTEPPPATGSLPKKWERSVDELRDKIRLWTGNRAQIVDISWAEWLTHRNEDGVFAEIARDAVDVAPKSSSVSEYLFGSET